MSMNNKKNIKRIHKVSQKACHTSTHSAVKCTTCLIIRKKRKVKVGMEHVRKREM
jgi:hypothetical protein